MGKQRKQPLIEAVKNSLATVPVMAYCNVHAETPISWTGRERCWESFGSCFSASEQSFSGMVAI